MNTKHFYLIGNEAKHLKYLEKQSSMVEDPCVLGFFFLPPVSAVG